MAIGSLKSACLRGRPNKIMAGSGASRSQDPTLLPGLACAQLRRPPSAVTITYLQQLAETDASKYIATGSIRVIRNQVSRSRVKCDHSPFATDLTYFAEATRMCSTDSNAHLDQFPCAQIAEEHVGAPRLGFRANEIACPAREGHPAA